MDEPTSTRVRLRPGTSSTPIVVPNPGIRCDDVEHDDLPTITAHLVPPPRRVTPRRAAQVVAIAAAAPGQATSTAGRSLHREGDVEQQRVGVVAGEHLHAHRQAVDGAGGIDTARIAVRGSRGS